MSFFEELKRRNVFKVGVAYAVACWLSLQIVDLVLENINAPDWVMQVFMLALAVGFPITIIIAWAFEVTPEGVKLHKNVDPSRSINRHTGHQLNRGIIVILSMAVVLLLTDRFRDELFGAPEAKKGSGSISQPVQSLTETSGNDKMEPGLSAAEKALEISPQSTEALIIKASYNEDHCHISDAARLYETAIASNPGDPTAHHWYARLLAVAGRTRLALDHIEKARNIDPLISAMISIEGDIYKILGDYTRAEQLQREAASLGLFGGSPYELGSIYLLAGEIERGKALIEKGRTGESPAEVVTRQLFLQVLDDPEKQALFEQHIGKADDSYSYATIINMEYLALLGSAYAFEYQSNVECVILDDSIWTESFRKQRKTPEFFEMMERAGVVEYWREFGWPDDCASMDQTLAECP